MHTALAPPLQLLACLSIHLCLSLSKSSSPISVQPFACSLYIIASVQIYISHGRHSSISTYFAVKDRGAAFVDICMDKLAPIKQQCLKLTNCSFKKAQSGSENPATLASRPSSCFYVTSGRFFLNGKSVRSCWTHRDKLFISLAWEIFFLLFRNICFQLQQGHGTSCLFFLQMCTNAAWKHFQIGAIQEFMLHLWDATWNPGCPSEAIHHHNYICFRLISARELHPSTFHCPHSFFSSLCIL